MRSTFQEVGLFQRGCRTLTLRKKKIGKRNVNAMYCTFKYLAAGWRGRQHFGIIEILLGLFVFLKNA